MISETSSTKLDKKKKKLDTLCFFWLSTHGTTQTFSHRRREFLRCLLSESYVAANLQISFFYFFQNL